MHDSSIHLTERVFPAKPVRQWVLSFPFFIRYLMAYDPVVVTAILKIQNQVISGWYRSKYKKTHKSKNLYSGAITMIQRFGGALNINPHFHSLFLDGVYLCEDKEDAPVQFLNSFSLCDEDQEKILKKIVMRVCSYLEKKGFIEESQENLNLKELHGASVTYRIAVGARQGEKVQLVGQELKSTINVSGGICNNGFNLHARVWVNGGERGKLEKLCRYILRGPLSRERITKLEKGKLAIRFKKPWSSGATHVVYTEDEFVEKLVALVPPQRAHLLRYHGVFAPNSKLRSRVCLMQESSKPEKIKSQKIPWAELLKRTFGIDPEKCKKCGAKLKPIAVIVRFELVDQILKGLKIESKRVSFGESRDPRGPPKEWFCEDYYQLPTDW